MNYFFKATTAVAFLCVFNTAKANLEDPVVEDPVLTFETRAETNNLVFELNSFAKESNIKIENFNGQVLFEEAIVSQANYQKRFNLKNLPEGKYDLTTENKLRSIVYTIDIKEGKAKLANKKIAYKPTFLVKGKKVYVHLLNAEGKEVKFDIYDSRDKHVFTETADGKMAMSKIFDLSDLRNGKYDIRVWDANCIYTESFYIK